MRTLIISSLALALITATPIARAESTAEPTEAAKTEKAPTASKKKRSAKKGHCKMCADSEHQAKKGGKCDCDCKQDKDAGKPVSEHT